MCVRSGRRRGWGRGLRIDLCGGGLLVDGLLPQVVAAFVLLLHAVDEEEDEEHGEHEADGAAGDHSCSRQTETRFISFNQTLRSLKSTFHNGVQSEVRGPFG